MTPPRAAQTLPEPAPSGPAPRARVAIIFDDAGADLAQLDPILALNRAVTVAVLPGLKASRGVSVRARGAGLEVLLHLPLEADDGTRALGPGGVTTTMSAEEIRAVVLAALDDVPGAAGVSGHMGSRATADRRVMEAVLDIVRERRLYFVDSRTTTRSVAPTIARALGVPVAERAVFLDNEDDPEAIAAQVRLVMAQAQAEGDLVAIGHAQKQTAAVLARLLPEFDRAGIVLVPASALVR